MRNYLSMLTAALLLPALAAQAATPKTNNQSLTKADRTCQRIVLENGPIQAREQAEPSDWSSTMLSLEASYGDLDDHFLGKGAQAYDATLAWGGIWRNQWQVTLLTGHEYYRWDGDAFELNGTYVQGALLYRFTDTLAAGPFFEAAYADIATEGLPDEHTMIYASGLLAMESWYINGFTIGLTGTLASMNKESLSDLFDSEDTAVAGLVDVHRMLTSSLGATAYAYYYSLIDNVRDTDGHYWLFGVELEQALSSQLSVAIGVSTLAGSDDYDENRVTAAIRYYF